ncbi:MAG: PEP-utilizing enzyme [Dehalococcoidia bacterium]
MTAPASDRRTYHCEDGTEFPVDWPSDDAPNHAWRWNEDHHPVPLQPLAAAIDHGRKPGGDQAYAEADVLPPHMFREWITANGFQYIRMSPLPPPELGELFARAQALAARYSGPCKVWEAHALPRVRDACERLRGLPAESPVEEAAYLFDYAFQVTQVAGPTVMQPVLMRLTGMLAEVIGPEGALLAQEVTQGGANATIASDQAIWEMGQMARSDAALMAIVSAAGREGAQAVAGLPVNHPFRRSFETYVDTYRWRSETWDPAYCTVGEEPHRVLGLIQQAIHAPSPAATAGEVGERRSREAVARIAVALQAQPEKLRQFRDLVNAFDGYVGVREGRALWQLTAVGSLRHALLNKGALLAQRDLLDTPGDVFFLLPAEVDRGTSGAGSDFRALVAQRRREWEHWKTKRPPHHIGAPVPPGPQPFPLPTESSGPVLRGVPASRGVVTAPVRVLTGLDEADSFEQGEVLVCAMTSPPWTPLFAIAAAVVTDSGSPLSHPAIAAREYGIPCVVGAKDASRKLTTGEVVTVDGAAGTVTRSQS